jgi:membrane-bound serine protease (ClpP class)
MLVEVTYILLILIGAAVMVFLIFYNLAGKEPWFFKLNKSDDGKLDLIHGLIKIGDVGESISGLRPMGKALIEGKEYEVTTNGEYVDQNKSIQVIGVLKNKITVSKIN